MDNQEECLSQNEVKKLLGAIEQIQKAYTLETGENITFKEFVENLESPTDYCPLDRQGGQGRKHRRSTKSYKRKSTKSYKRKSTKSYLRGGYGKKRGREKDNATTKGWDWADYAAFVIVQGGAIAGGIGGAMVVAHYFYPSCYSMLTYAGGYLMSFTGENPCIMNPIRSFAAGTVVFTNLQALLGFFNRYTYRACARMLRQMFSSREELDAALAGKGKGIAGLLNQRRNSDGGSKRRGRRSASRVTKRYRRTRRTRRKKSETKRSRRSRRSRRTRRRTHHRLR